MIDYTAFHNYLVELMELYQRTRSTKGMSQLAQKYHCTAITRDQFYQMKLDKLQPSQVTPQLSRVIRDTIGKSDAKAALRESIGALNEGILAGSRISQGSDRTVQITITQPEPTDASNYQQKTIEGYRNLPDIFTMDDIFRCFHYDSIGSACSRLKRLQDDHLAEKIQTGENKGKYRKVPVLNRFVAGQVVMRKTKTGNLILLIEKIGSDNLQWKYGMSLNEDRSDNILTTAGSENYSCPFNMAELRPAKGNEIARFLGALTRSGFEWEADNTNGLFFVKSRRQERKPVEVFANELPDGCRTIYALPAVAPSPYRYALEVESPVDFAHDYMTDRRSTYPAQTNAILRQMRQAVGSDVAHGGFDSIRDYYEYTLPSLCSAYGDGSMREHTVALVKDDNNGTCYWLARDRDVLRLLAWVAYII